ncbi:hypothetical protein EXIGLDRAFT_838243 [Exidia glandulosa HHB12029]|uniref:SGNH hydrolase n=1 Tax=Exidia glandulosa HHB12029 TaxID=1314781 RepID=A0A165G1U9_EXIGL|nr:hypothetical protein EXIGLDRAFT_838243 [Exidia glandulosa HHB12029]
MLIARARQPSTLFVLLNACIVTALIHYWTSGRSLHAVSVWIGQNLEHEHGHDYPQNPPPSQFAGPASCGGGGANDTMCAVYGEDILARSRAYEGANARFRRVLRDAKAGKHIKIGVLGGSVTNGQGVKQHEIWANVFAEWWKQEFPDGEMTIQNGAIAATGTNYMSMCYLEHIDDDADIVLTEFAINDQRYDFNAESFEWLLRQLLELPKRPAVINIQTFGLAYQQLTTGGDLHIAAANYYDTPLISLRNALLPQLLDTREAGPNYFHRLGSGGTDFNHINPRGHQMLADLLIAYTQRQLCALSSSPLPPDAAPSYDDLPLDLEGIPPLRLFQNYNDPPALHLSPYCTSTRTLKHPLIPSFNSGWENWTYTAPGGTEKSYVRATQPGSKIGFKIPVRGGMGRVRLSYLRSATFGLGICKCWLDEDEEAGVLVDGFWDKPLNVALVVIITKTASVGDHVLSCELMDKTHDPEGRTEFRLIAVDAA